MKTQATPVPRTETRLSSIDRVRGLVMMVMALDHVRDFIGPDVGFMAIDPEKTPPALFLTRYVTHFCAPIFVLLAGLASGLASQNGRSVKELERYLLFRGLLLAGLEVTLVRFAWLFDVTYRETYLGVLWAIGLSMVLAAPFVRLSSRVTLGIGIVGIALHNLLDGLQARSFGDLGPLFSLLHEPHLYEPVEGFHVFVLYTLVPWVFVFLFGRGLAPLFSLPLPERNRRLVALGLGLLVLFVIVRLSNGYGDPLPWKPNADALLQLLAILDCRKYPPSLAYLLMTLGPAFFLLAILERKRSALLVAVERFGQVPLFYYVAHLLLAHALALALYFVVYGTAALEFGENPALRPRFSLPSVYGMTVVVLALLYPACAWFAELKKKRRDLAILRYL